MEDGILRFSEKSREELIEEILEKEKRIDQLEKKLKVEEEKSKRLSEFKLVKFAKIKKRKKKPGQKLGHIGKTRAKPEMIHRVVEQKLKQCPDCHHKLSQSQEVTRHIQEDIVPAHVEVTCFKKHRYYCKECQKMVSAACAREEIPQGYLGPNVLVQTLILKYHHGLPYNKIQELFEGLCGLKVSCGALAQALQRMSQWLEVEKREILKSIRASPHIHMDETGWKVGGTKHWLWAAVNERLAYYQIDRSRGKKVVKGILGQRYQGVLITDFYAAYNRVDCEKQKCLVHLMREMHECFKKDQSVKYVRYHKELKRIIQDALRLKEQSGSYSAEVYVRRLKRLKERLFRWSTREYENKHLKKLSQRFLKHWVNLLTFLKYPEVSADNNHAERMIRHHVILRNRSFQNRSKKGLRAHETNMSLLHTLQLQGRDVVDSLKTAYLHHRHGNSQPILAF